MGKTLSLFERFCQRFGKGHPLFARLFQGRGESEDILKDLNKAGVRIFVGDFIADISDFKQGLSAFGDPEFFGPVNFVDNALLRLFQQKKNGCEDFLNQNGGGSGKPRAKSFKAFKFFRGQMVEIGEF